MEALKRQRGVVKGSMTRLTVYTKGALDKVNLDEIYVKLNRATQLLTEFTEIEKNMFNEDPTVESDLADFEDNYYAVLASLNAHIRKRSLTPPVNTQQLNNTTMNMSQSHAGEVRLPKIMIPTFKGNYLEWQSFYDIYSSTIHDKEHLTAAQKFQYLKGLLDGEPAALIRHLAVTDANYHEAFQKLIQRYDRKQYTINSFIKCFMEQPGITQPTSTNIRQMADAFDEVIRGLKALGENAERRDHWLIYIALTKMDKETRALWAQDTAEIELPTFEQLLKFLNKRTDTLEAENGFSEKTQGHKAQSIRSPKLRSFATTTFPQCSICNQGEHLINQCDRFKNMTPDQRSTTIKSMFRCFNCLSKNHRVYECKSKSRCQRCHRKHHSMLHEAVASTSTENTKESAQESIPKEQSQPTACASTFIKTVTTILPTAIVNVRDRHGEFQSFKALLDSASQSSFITESCVQKLALDRRHGRLLIKGIGETTIGQTRGVTNLWIAPTRDSQTIWETEAFIVPKISVTRNQHNIPTDTIALKELQLADPTFNESNAIDLLLGVDIFARAVQGQSRKLTSGLVAMNTVFGWVIAGSNNTANQEIETFTTLVDIDRTLKQFWETEEITTSKKSLQLTDEEEACENLFRTTTTKGADNKFSVRLPFRKLYDSLSSSFYLAMNRLMSLERKFRINKEFKEMYVNFINEYIQLGHMTRIKGPASRESYYLPHHGVFRETSSTTKLRVVFDGSAKSTNGISLNEALMVGPTVQDSLIQILIRFRQHKFALTGDIEKMYRQVWVEEKDRCQQNILWRDDPSSPLHRYQLNTLTYGTASAPFLATRTLHEVGVRNLENLPVASHIIMRDFYVDDLMSGAETTKDLVILMNDITKILSDNGFNLRKLLSNSSVIQKVIESKEASNVKSIVIHPTSTKVLGLFWDSARDTFQFSGQIDEHKVISKRTLLSEAGKIFDPLGWLSPLTIRVKMIFQNLWLHNLSWDDELPTQFLRSWTDIREELRKIDTLTVPRWLGTTREVSLHGFSDASEKADAAVVYAVTQNNIPILIAAKTRVAPLKQQSLPRLELMGALLVSNLVKTIELSLDLNVTRRTLWTDSKIVLDWLATQPRRWATFIANRTSQIINDHPNSSWKHVPGKENPADIASRGTSLVDLEHNKLWWNGPDWLIDEHAWPKQSKRNVDLLTTEEMRPTIQSMHTIVENFWYDELIARFSSYHTLIKILAMIRRYITNLRSTTKLSGNITKSELSEAEHRIINYMQMKEFSNDINQISKGTPLPKNSKLKTLNPFIDDKGLLRVGGRIQKSVATFAVKHPIILSNHGNLPKLILRDLHCFHHHAGIGFLASIARRKFWILRMKQVAKQIVLNCVSCFRQHPKSESQLMGNLPEARVVYSYPFDKVGVDYCGPFKVHAIRKRGQIPSKAYICIFICLSTRAVHIEVAMNLTTDSFIGALKRFIARRGICSTIYSDNGSNFIGAKNELQDMYNFIKTNSNNISAFLLRNKIEWCFNPPAASHMGGIWEAAVKIAKTCLKKTLGETIPTLEEFSTLITQIEAMMNSRPICTNNSEDIDVLTPAHFLIGRPLTDVPEVDITNQIITSNARWRLIKQLKQHFWKRWNREYLTLLQTRQKWHSQRNNVLINDLVLLVDNSLPPTRWALGKIINLHPGPDGNVRVVTVKLGNTGNIVKRPIHKICKLPVEGDTSIESTDSRGPECYGTKTTENKKRII